MLISTPTTPLGYEHTNVPINNPTNFNSSPRFPVDPHLLIDNIKSLMNEAVPVTITKLSNLNGYSTIYSLPEAARELNNVQTSSNQAFNFAVV